MRTSATDIVDRETDIQALADAGKPLRQFKIRWLGSNNPGSGTVPNGNLRSRRAADPRATTFFSGSPWWITWATLPSGPSLIEVTRTPALCEQDFMNCIGFLDFQSFCSATASLEWDGVVVD